MLKYSLPTSAGGKRNPNGIHDNLKEDLHEDSKPESLLELLVRQAFEPVQQQDRSATISEEYHQNCNVLSQSENVKMASNSSIDLRGTAREMLQDASIVGNDLDES
ncbi:hypothetical protein AgCh_025634 [Apium graveolens]